VEECIKALAELYDTPEHREAAREGRWWAQLLGKAARRLARELNEPRIEYAWAVAYDVHVWGFHEAKYTVEDVLDKSERGELALEEADEFLELARKVAKEYGEYPGAWKLHTYATITRALTAKKYAEKGGGSPVAPVSRPRRRFAPTCAALGAARGASERPSRRSRRLEPGARAPFSVGRAPAGEGI